MFAHPGLTWETKKTLYIYIFQKLTHLKKKNQIFVKDSPLVSSEHWSINTGLSEDVDVAENTRKHSVSVVTAPQSCGHPCLRTVVEQHTKHAAL